ncbi:hypothetical protein [Streptomyces afghaniensis]|uniref:hypothetical protein n=1 Tax=Streptomyces afghaniensis TaxID=66865 RepID=UPI0027855380|nr:hypothetical protein [Streptomyces afghaniensis]MDQ1018956.1 hypothetical protein [Streptomyces afghaniensis]
MPVEPVPCAPEGGSTPIEVTTCCAPSVASAPLCRADGTTILAVVRSGCVECGEVPEDPEVVGWLDVAGTFTPGALPTDAGPCEAGCVDTVCRALCDDTDGDGAADATYSELWCIRADGSAELVLTYQDDPSVPYVPISPVDCTYGCPDHETVMLCDASGPFLRRYVFLSGTATYEDVALDGQTPHVVTGTVGACAGDAGSGATPCAEQTTPAATLGLCLADGTPIAVVVTRDCVTDTVTQDGWLNLTTGTYSAGAPPAGAQACGDSRAFELAGLLCDVDPGTGDVLGVVLVEYEYNPDGSLASVRLINPADGSTYTLQGELTVCPAGAGQPAADQDLTVLCDVQADGTSVPFLRDYRRDVTTGQINGHTDYGLDGTLYTVAGTVGTCSPDTDPCGQTETLTLCDTALDGTVTAFLRHLVYDCAGQVTNSRDTRLDGTTPYVITGTVGQCAPEAEPCRNTSTVLLCDLPTDGTPTPTVTDTPGAPYYPYTTGVPAAGAQALWDGGALTLPDAAGPQSGTGGTVRTAAAILQAPRPVCDTGTAHVTVQVDVTQLGPDDGCRATGFLGLYNGTGEANRVALALAPPDTPAGWTGTLTVEADVPADDLAAGNIAVALAFDAYDDSGATCPPPRRTGWQLDDFAATVAYDQTGCAAQFLRSITLDCETGAIVSVTDTTLDGDPYTVTGEPGQCTPASGGGTVVEPCGDTEVAQLCDLTYDPQAPIPTPARDFALTGNVVAANNGTTLWFAQANQPANGVAELTVSGLLPTVLYEFRFASAWVGAGNPTPATNNAIYLLEILDGTTVLANRTRNVSNGSNVFPGGMLTEDLPPVKFIAPATGTVRIRFTDQTTGGPVNDRDLFLMPQEVRTAALTLTRTPFLRRFTFDCDGGLTSTEDLGLDGVTPYTVQGEAGACTADGATAGTVTPCDVQNVIEACRCDDTDADGLPDVGYVELLAVDCDGNLTSLGTYTDGLTGPYTPVAPVDCDTLDDEEGAEPASGVQAQRRELAAGQSWSAAAWPTLQSVTAVAHGGTGTVTTADGTSTLHTGEAATWSVARDADALLTGPLTIAADSGTVTVSYTIGVTL